MEPLLGEGKREDRRKETEGNKGNGMGENTPKQIPGYALNQKVRTP